MKKYINYIIPITKVIKTFPLNLNTFLEIIETRSSEKSDCPQMFRGYVHHCDDIDVTRGE